MIYTRDHCHCTFRWKLHGFMVKYRDTRNAPLLPLLFITFFNSSPFYRPQLLHFCPLYSSVSFFSLYIITFLPFTVYLPFRCSLFVPFACDIVSFSNWTRIMSARPLPPARPFRFPVYHRVTAPSRLLLFLFREANKARMDGILCRVRS